MAAPNTPDRPFNVLFLCTGNTARSVLAEGILRRDGAGRFNAYSAGSRPKGAVNPFALKALDAYGYPATGYRSKSWDEFAAPGAPVMDFVFTVCDQAANEPCPIWPGHPITAHWGVPDPAAADGNEAERMLAFRDAFAVLGRRIAIFASLPLNALDTLATRREVEAIGRDAATARQEQAK